MSDAVAVYALTRQGLLLARTLAQALGGEVHATRRLDAQNGAAFDSLPDHVAKTFEAFDGHVFVTAAGIAVRCVAPHLKGKDRDPAVVCLDQRGRFAVSLLSGHLGGANELALRCAAVTGGQAVVTTATDAAGLPSVDVMARDADMVIGNLDRVKVVNGALLGGRTVQVWDPGGYFDADAHGLFRPTTAEAWRMGDPGVWASWKEDCPDVDALRLYPRRLMLGVGCRRGVPKAEICGYVRDVFDRIGLALDAVGGLASVDIKVDEPGLLETAADLGVTPTFFAPDELDRMTTPNPSAVVRRNLGVPSVAEAAALLLADGGELLVPKTKTSTVTLAVARKP